VIGSQTEAYETSVQLCAHRGNTEACAVEDRLHRSVSQSTDIFTNKSWRDCPSPLTIIVPCVTSSTMTSTDHSLPQTTVYCCLHVFFMFLKYSTAHVAALCVCLWERGISSRLT